MLGLLLLIGVVAIFLGYSQWCRANILRQVEEIKQLGGDVQLPVGYLDYFWQRVPNKGSASLLMSDKDRRTKAETIEQRMRALGINEIEEFYSL